jgi:hypothetical protein
MAEESFIQQPIISESSGFQRTFNSIALPEAKSFATNYDYGFFSDTKDEFHLSWLGQVIQHFSEDDAYRDADLDITYNPFSDENIAGFEDYSESFKDVKNREHHDFIKLKITQNNQARKRLDDSDRYWGPMLVSLLADPITYVPIPFARGISFAARAAKGALISGAVVGATEPFRQAYDPTSRVSESLYVVGGGALMGGILSGAFGSRTVSKLFIKEGENASDVSKTLADNLQDSLNAYDGTKNWPKNGFLYNVSDDISGKIEVEPADLSNATFDQSGTSSNPIAILTNAEDASYTIKQQVKDAIFVGDDVTKISSDLKLSPKEVNDIIGEINRKGSYLDEVGEELGMNNIVPDVPNKQIILLDEVASAHQFRNGTHLISGIKGVKNLPDVFKSVSDFQQFAMKKAVLKSKYYPKNSTKELQDISEIQYEELINNTALEELRLQATIPQTINAPKFLTFFKKNASNSGRILLNLPDDIESKLMWGRLFNDNAVGLAGAEYGLASPSSALMEYTTKRVNTYMRVQKTVDNLFVKMRKGDPTGSLLWGVNPQAYAFRVGDFFRKITFRNPATDEQGKTLLTREDFNEMISVYRMSPELFDDAPKELVQASNIYGEFFKKYGGEAIDEGMLASQKNYERLLRRSKSRQKAISAEIRKARGNTIKFPETEAEIIIGPTGSYSKPNVYVEKRYKPAFTRFNTKTGKGTIYLDEKYIKEVMYPKRGWEKPRVKGVNPIEKGIINSREEYFDFIKMHEIMHANNSPESLGLPKRTKKINPDYENAINDMAVAQIKKTRSRKNIELEKSLNTLLAKEKGTYGDLETDFKNWRVTTAEKNSYSKSGSSSYDDSRFMPRHWRVDKILANPAGFKKILKDHFAKDRVGERALDEAGLDKLVDDTYDKIVYRDGAYQDGEGVLGLGNRAGSLTVGAKSLMQRSLDIDNLLVKDYIELDIAMIAEKYADRMGKSLELKKVIGDVNMEDWLVREELRLSVKYIGQGDSKKAGEIRQTLQAFIDEKDKWLGAFNTTDPASISKKMSSILRGTQSLAIMGKVLITSLTESARAPVVHGFSRTFGVGLYNYLLNSSGAWKNALREMNYLSEAIDNSMFKATNRASYQNNNLSPGESFGSRALDKLARVTDQAQSPFYWLTGLTSWTRFWKDLTGVISQHRFIEDSIKLSKGQGTQKELKKIAYVLNTYGIGKKEADLISRMPWQKQGNLYMANVEAWSGKEGGEVAIKKIRQAIQSDVERTIVTPSVGDRPNMMDGAKTFTGDKTVRALDTKLGRALTGAERTDYGVKVNSSWGSMAFQFLGWGFAANNRIVISGLQGRDANMLGGTAFAITLGILVGAVKNPYGFDKMMEEKAIDELILDGIDRSGILGLWSEVDAISDGFSRAFLGTAISSRGAFNLPAKYGADGSIAEAATDVLGPVSSQVFNVVEALSGNSNQSGDQAIARLMPYYNLIGFNRITKPMYDTAWEKVFDQFD